MRTDGIIKPGDVRYDASRDGDSLVIATHRDHYRVDTRIGSPTRDELFVGETHVPDPDYAHRWRLYSDVLASGKQPTLGQWLLAMWGYPFYLSGLQ